MPASASVRGRMREQRRRDTAPEMALRRELHRRGRRYRVDRAPLPGLRRRADLVFPTARVAVFVDGCFWHRCPVHGTAPKNNAGWWAEKLDANVVRDRDTDARLAAAGWRVVRVWEHQDPVTAADAVDRVLDRPADPPTAGAPAAPAQ
ncbi:DNA mismatch endonuclease Vsr [Rhodococcus kronopolitis]|uniref:DNA mismatch endonuclease Vsr n=1 Tax=Rhodococcus kronopolitis TaxID=1460226 RepID=A0ABV9FRX0_9NOCA